MDQLKVGKFIAILRKEKKLTQEQLGERLGVTNKTVSRWETGNYMPDIEMLQIMSQLFDVTINEIVAGERVADSKLREISNQTVIDIVKSEKHALKEKEKHLRNKWLKSHIVLLVVLIVSFIALYFALFSLRGLFGEWAPMTGYILIFIYFCIGVLLSECMKKYIKTNLM